MSDATPWLRQARRDLDASRLLLDSGFFEWSCYAAAQAAEKSAKAMLVAWGADLAHAQLGKPLRTHVLADLMHCFRRLPPNEDLARALTALPAHDQQARYPGVGGDAAPCERYDAERATLALELAAKTVEHCDAMVTRLESAWAQLASGGPP